MRTLLVVLMCVVLFSAVICDPARTTMTTVSADTVSVGEVRRQREIVVTSLANSADTLIVERPVGAREGTKSSVFVVTDTAGVLHWRSGSVRSRLVIVD